MDALSFDRVCARSGCREVLTVVYTLSPHHGGATAMVHVCRWETRAASIGSLSTRSRLSRHRAVKRRSLRHADAAWLPARLLR